jgi:replication initiation and membrane attachment protein DnaB
MGEIKELTSFYEAILDDPRIGPTHISLYMALFQLYNVNGLENPVEINRHQVMRVAKINGIATYHKCIQNLEDFGYIRYRSSFNPAIKSQVFLVACDL